MFVFINHAFRTRYYVWDYVWDYDWKPQSHWKLLTITGNTDNAIRNGLTRFFIKFKN